LTDDEIRHLTGWRAPATAAAGLGLLALAARAGAEALQGAEGWVFWALVTVAAALAGVVVGTLPWRLTSRIDGEGVTVGWALGRLRVPWDRVRRVVIGFAGSGGERDTITVTLLLRDGREVLFAALGRRDPKEDPGTRALVRAAEARGIPVEDTLAPPEEIKKRMRQWREARIKGWR